MFDRSAILRHPCFIWEGFDHDFESVDYSYDHAYGTESLHILECKLCGFVSDIHPNDYYEFDPDECPF